MNLLKVNASEMAIATVTSALQACGLAGYRNDGEFSIGRHLRDVLSSSIMINNDRILSNVATTSFLVDVPAFLTDQPRRRESNIAVEADTGTGELAHLKRDGFSANRHPA
jgi:hypothetical protein